MIVERSVRNGNDCGEECEDRGGRGWICGGGWTSAEVLGVIASLLLPPAPAPPASLVGAGRVLPERRERVPSVTG